MLEKWADAVLKYWQIISLYAGVACLVVVAYDSIEARHFVAENCLFWGIALIISSVTFNKNSRSGGDAGSTSDWSESSGCDSGGDGGGCDGGD